MSEKLRKVEVANEVFEARRAEGLRPRIKDVEGEFGLGRNQLVNFRANRARLVKAAAEGAESVAAAAGVPVVEDGNGDEVQEWPLDRIRMRGNVRGVFDEEELEALARSIRATFLMQWPVGYVVTDESGVRWLELVAGERRLRAHELLRDRGEDVATMRVRVIARPSDREFLRLNFVENLQRVNLSPTEVARGIRRMLDLVDPVTGMAPYNVATVAEDLGLREERVIRALHALEAPEGVRSALDEGRVSLEVAATVGALPVSLRESAAEALVFGSAGPMREKEARLYVAHHLRVDLRRAEFDRSDGSLTAAGACDDCGWCGRNREDLRGVSAAYQCLNPVCFREKSAAHAARERERMVNEGGDVVLLEDGEAARLWDGTTGRLSPTCGYVEAKARPEPFYLADGDRNRESAPTWRQACGEDLPTVFVAWDERHRKVELLERGPALLAALGGRYGSLFRAEAARGLLSREEAEAQRRTEAAVRREGLAVCREGARELLSALEGSGFGGAELVALVGLAVEQGCKPDDTAFLCEVLDPEMGRSEMTGRGLAELVGRRSGDADAMMALLFVVLQVRTLRYGGFDAWCEEGPAADLCERAGFDAAAWRTRWKRRRAAAERGRGRAGK